MNIKSLRALILPALEAFVEEDFNILLANVSTEDGFVVGHKNSVTIEMDDDKIAAISSSLLSLAEASVCGIRDGSFRRTIVESDSSHLLIVKGYVRKIPLVFTVVANDKATLAHTLYLTSRLTGKLEKA